MAAMKSVLFLASTALVLLQSSSSAFVIPSGSSRVGERSGIHRPARPIDTIVGPGPTAVWRWLKVPSSYCLWLAGFLLGPELSVV